MYYIDIAKLKAAIQTNPNGRQTMRTPNSMFLTLCPMKRSIDKLDEENTLRSHIKKNPALLKDREITNLWNAITSTSKEMDKMLKTNVSQSGSEDSIAEKEFGKLREINHVAIDSLAQKLFGDCGIGGNFARRVQEYLVPVLFAPMIGRR